MNIYDLFRSWGVDYDKLQNNAGRQSHLFTPCNQCGQEFTDSNLLSIHTCPSFICENFETERFNKIFAKKKCNKIICRLCDKETENFYDLVKHFTTDHKKNERFIIENWYKSTIL
jgi:hypothetical protein